ncbi:MAG TPA: hypothetical protein VGN13_00290 [Solirubrobacteraceae bacterium]
MAPALALGAAGPLTAGAVAAPVTSTVSTPGWGTFLRVPPGVVAVEVTAVGAAGGSGCAPGGRGARVSARLPVAAGEELRGEVGDVGEPNEALREEPGGQECHGGTGKGWYDGGAGWMGSGGFPGGGSAGGGASWLAAVPQDFPCCLNMRPWAQGRLLTVAGGGGGGGYGSGASGGDAGASGETGHVSGIGGRGGLGGTAGAGGAGGLGAQGGECKGSGETGATGGEAHGATGGAGNLEILDELFPEYEPAGGGGGGGGYFGGGGGGGGAHNDSFKEEALTCLHSGGGGGGSSFAAAGPLVAEPTGEAAHITISYEILAPPAAVLSTPVERAVYEQGQAVPAAFACSDSAGAPGVVACEGSCWRFSAGGFLTTPISNGADLPTSDAGEYRCQLAARSADALSTITPRKYTVLPRRAPQPPAGPVIGHLSQTRARWRAGGRLPAVLARSRVAIGTIFSFTLNEQASVRLSFERIGRHSRHTAGSIKLDERRGRTALYFDGRLAGKGRRLTPGAYAITALAANARHEVSQRRTLRFVIVR